MQVNMKFKPVDIARLFLFIRESTQNHGQRVEAIQHWSGGVPGDSWCCHLATMVLDICFQGNSPIPRLGACQQVYDLAKKNDWVLKDNEAPTLHDIFLYVNDADHAHHIGFVSGPMDGIAGNTSEDGKSSNGNGVYEHAISQNRKYVKYVRYPKTFLTL